MTAAVGSCSSIPAATIAASGAVWTHAVIVPKLKGITSVTKKKVEFPLAVRFVTFIGQEKSDFGSVKIRV
jgi:hypothetical protein